MGRSLWIRENTDDIGFVLVVSGVCAVYGSFMLDDYLTRRFCGGYLVCSGYSHPWFALGLFGLLAIILAGVVFLILLPLLAEHHLSERSPQESAGEEEC